MSSGEGPKARGSSSISRPGQIEINKISPKSSFNDDPAVSARKIEEKLKNLVLEGGKVHVLGLSPTGGGPTARLLNVADFAMQLDRQDIKPGDVIISYIPELWKGGDPKKAIVSPQWGKIGLKAQEVGVMNILESADKSVQGFLKKSGASDDPKILSHFAKHPIRPPGEITDIKKEKIFEKEGDIHAAPTMSAEHLANTLQRIIGREAMKTSVKVLTDMDPALISAFEKCGANPDNMVDQTNHNIMIEQEKPDEHGEFQIKPLNEVVIPGNAIVAKVGGRHAKPSMIGLGDKNNISALGPVAERLEITSGMLKSEAIQKSAQHLLTHGNVVDPQGELDRVHGSHETPAVLEGIVKSDSIKTAADVKNIIYFYAHGTQTSVGAAFQKHMNSPDAPEAFRHTILVLCGGSTLSKEGNRTGDGMKAATLGMGDAITTSGNGTHGEWAYPKKHADSRAKLMALPIADHAEQQLNSKRLGEQDPKTKDDVTVVKNQTQEGIDAAVKQFVSEAYDNKEAKLEGTMEKMLNAIDDPETYVKQAADLLYRDAALTPKAEAMRKAASELIDSPELKLHRRQVKAVLVAFDQLDSAIDSRNQPVTNIETRFAHKERMDDKETVDDYVSEVLRSEKIFKDFLANETPKERGTIDRAKVNLGIKKPKTDLEKAAQNAKLEFFKNIKDVFDFANKLGKRPVEDSREIFKRRPTDLDVRTYDAKIQDLKNMIEAMRKNFGHAYKTGF